MIAEVEAGVGPDSRTSLTWRIFFISSHFTGWLWNMSSNTTSAHRDHGVPRSTPKAGSVPHPSFIRSPQPKHRTATLVSSAHHLVL